MASFACFPPTITHSTTRISPSTALTHLSDYLARSATDLSLLPNAQLTESGPAVGSSSAQGGVVIHNLRRVEAGLKGEYLAATVGADAEAAVTDSVGVKVHAEVATVQQPSSPTKKRKRQIEDDMLTSRPPKASGQTLLSQSNPAASQQDFGAKNGWQDKSEYEQSQNIEQGELGQRDNAVVRDDTTQPPTINTATEEVSKEERRRRKKDRHLEEKRAREAKRRQMAEEDRRRDLEGEEVAAAKMNVDGRNEEINEAMGGGETAQILAGEAMEGGTKKKKKKKWNAVDELL